MDMYLLEIIWIEGYKTIYKEFDNVREFHHWYIANTDEEDLSKALVAVLKHNNYSVDAVYNGQNALDYLETENYDGAILDIMMPKMDGLTVLRKLML